MNSSLVRETTIIDRTMILRDGNEIETRFHLCDVAFEDNETVADNRDYLSRNVSRVRGQRDRSER